MLRAKTILRLRANTIYCKNFGSFNVFKQECLKNLLHLRLRQPTIKIRNFNNQNMSTLSKLKNNHIFGRNFNIRQILTLRLNIYQIFKNNCTNPLKYHTKISNNVMLYRYEKPMLYKLAMVFGIFTTIGCLSMANNVYLVSYKDLLNKNIDLKTRLSNNVLFIFLITIGILSGPIIIGIIWCITIRSVKYLILRKGSETATIITYHPLKGENILTVPVDDISCTIERDQKRPSVNIKIRNYKFQYILDKNGNFVNPELFDATIGIRRF